MSPTPRFRTTRPDQVHPTQARLAFLTEREHAQPALIRSVEHDRLELLCLDRSERTVRVHQADRLATVLGRDDLCRLHGLPLAMVNLSRRVLAVATGPATPPRRLEVLVVCELDDEGGVVELLSGSDDQPSWQTFALADDESS